MLPASNMQQDLCNRNIDSCWTRTFTSHVWSICWSWLLILLLHLRRRITRYVCTLADGISMSFMKSLDLQIVDHALIHVLSTGSASHSPRTLLGSCDKWIFPSLWRSMFADAWFKLVAWILHAVLVWSWQDSTLFMIHMQFLTGFRNL